MKNHMYATCPCFHKKGFHDHIPMHYKRMVLHSPNNIIQRTSF
uniref:Uncharacterized protein n=1 Tax=Rhizophora mucronata TaxID=61149 RepID=A0A2P2PMI9_RHIMU